MVSGILNRVTVTIPPFTRTLLEFIHVGIHSTGRTLSRPWSRQPNDVMSEIECAQLHRELFRRRHSALLSHGLFALTEHLFHHYYTAGLMLGMSLKYKHCRPTCIFQKRPVFLVKIMFRRCSLCCCRPPSVHERARPSCHWSEYVHTGSRTYSRNCAERYLQISSPDQV